MVVALAQDQVGALARRQDVLVKIGEIDRGPDRVRCLHRLFFRQLRIAMEIGGRVLERGAAQAQEALDIPAPDRFLVGIEIDREIEEVGDEGLRFVSIRRLPRLQDVQPFDNENIRPVDRNRFALKNIVGEVRIDRRLYLGRARLHIGEEAEQALDVEALGETLALHQPALFEHLVRIEEAVGRDEIDFRMVRPAREQRAQNARHGGLPHRDRARDADDIGHLVGTAEKVGGDAVKFLHLADIEIEEPRQRQEDFRHLVERDALTETLQLLEFLLGKRQRRILAQPSPILRREMTEGRKGFPFLAVHDTGAAHDRLRQLSARAAFSSRPERPSRRSSSA